LTSVRALATANSLQLSWDASAERGSRPSRAVGLALTLFLLACVFDPADRFLGLKVDFFLLAWLLTGVRLLWRGEMPSVHPQLLIYTGIFLLVPVASIAWYWVVDGSQPFEGLPLLKAYLLMTLALLLFIEKIDLLPRLALILTWLSVAIFGTVILLAAVPDLYGPIYVFGNATGIVFLDRRDYGAGLVLTQTYFVTSPMLVIPIAHYFGLWRDSPRRATRLKYFLLMAFNVAAMVLAGTRNNLVVAALLPLSLFFLSARRKIVARAIVILAVVFLTAVFFENLRVLFDPREFSNSLKIALLDDYGALFSDPGTLLLGQGLGAYHSWAARGGVYLFVSELTYLEMVRSFGVFGALALLVLLLFPIAYVFFINRSSPEKNVVVGYAYYLVMCASNPNLFSSMGMLILAIVLANVFRTDSALLRREAGSTR
jgi:hypothetical protein